MSTSSRRSAIAYLSQAVLNQVFSDRPIIITQITYALHDASPKLRKLACEFLAALCLVKAQDGHKSVMSAFSDYRVAFDEDFRFQELVRSIQLQQSEDGLTQDDVTSSDDVTAALAWEAKAASMTLVNALTNFLEPLEDRIGLREEFGRRGLNEVMAVRRDILPS